MDTDKHDGFKSWPCRCLRCFHLRLSVSICDSFMLQLHALSKKFGEFAALQDVNFSVRPGEIVGLLGENGAGKSTLLKIIGGEIAPTSGTLSFDNSPLHLRSPREATRLGIGVVHQHFMLVPVFTVAENMALHALRGAAFQPDYWARQIEKWADSLGWKIDPQARVADLSVGEQQRVEILRRFLRAEKRRSYFCSTNQRPTSRHAK